MTNDFISGETVICIDDSAGKATKRKMLKYGEKYITNHIFVKEKCMTLVGLGASNWSFSRFVRPEDFNSLNHAINELIQEEVML